ncbi:MAG: pseudouridine synthase [bacterium]|nr:pseudouridine synthase [bacterium]
MPSIKLQQALAQAGVASRRKAEEMILAKRIKVNGELAHIGQRVDLALDKIEFDQQLVTQPEGKRYFLVYKPAGLVSTTSDEQGRETVLSLLPKDVSERLFPVGRLDKDSEGLLLLTNDGEYANTLLHPSFGTQKTYEVTVTGSVSSKALEHLRRGVKLKEGYIAPDSATILDVIGSSTILEVVLSEGKKHEIRRMMRRIGYIVTKLVRTKFGPYSLETLEETDCIELPPPIK